MGMALVIWCSLVTPGQFAHSEPMPRAQALEIAESAENSRNDGWSKPRVVALGDTFKCEK